VPAGRSCNLGGRDFDVGERARMEQAGIGVIDAEAFRDGATRTSHRPWKHWLGRPDAAYVHIDLDVLDPSEAPTNMFQTPGGLSALSD